MEKQSLTCTAEIIYDHLLDVRLRDGASNVFQQEQSLRSLELHCFGVVAGILTYEKPERILTYASPSALYTDAVILLNSLYPL